jgi:hypothetical protein
MVRDTEVNADLLLVGIELLCERNGIRRAIGIRDIEDKPVGKDAARNSEKPQG